MPIAAIFRTVMLAITLYDLAKNGHKLYVAHAKKKEALAKKPNFWMQPQIENHG